MPENPVLVREDTYSKQFLGTSPSTWNTQEIRRKTRIHPDSSGFLNRPRPCLRDMAKARKTIQDYEL